MESDGIYSSISPLSQYFDTSLRCQRLSGGYNAFGAMDHTPSTWVFCEFWVHDGVHMASIDRHSSRQMRALSKFERYSPKPGDESKNSMLKVVWI